MLASLIKPNLSLLKPIKGKFEDYLERNIERLGSKSKLRDACEYALLNGGKRIRPLIVMMTADALGYGLDVMEATLSVEYFHTASLIADDLPCMDNDDFRREKPSVHKMFGETVALLASYALISAGYEKIFNSVQVLSRQERPFGERANEVCVVALENATRCSGISGATGGQFLDLFPEGSGIEEIREVIYKKTVTLFEVSFVFGWIFGGGEFRDLEKIKKVARHFGMAFQIADDLGDVEQDGEDTLNIAHCLGVKKAKEFFKEEIEKFTVEMKHLELFTPEFQQVTDFLSHQTKKH